MQELENNLAMSDVIDLKNLSCDKVVFGSTVTVEDSNTGKKITYQLVGPVRIGPRTKPDFRDLADRQGADRQVLR